MANPASTANATQRKPKNEKRFIAMPAELPTPPPRTNHFRLTDAYRQVVRANTGSANVLVSPILPDIGRAFSIDARMLPFHALGQASVQGMKNPGIWRVKMLSSGNSSDRPICRSDANNIYSLDVAPVLPHEGCTCESGCTCIAIGTQLAVCQWITIDMTQLAISLIKNRRPASTAAG